MMKMRTNADLFRTATSWLAASPVQPHWPSIQRRGALNYRAAAGLTAFGLLIAGLTLPVYNVTHDDPEPELAVVAEVADEPQPLTGAAALAAAPSLVGTAAPVAAAKDALGKYGELRSYSNLVIATPREDYTKMVRRAAVIEELLRRLDAESLDKSDAKLAKATEQMVDYAIDRAIRLQDLPEGVEPDVDTVLQNAITSQTLRLETAVSSLAEMVDAAPQIDPVVAAAVLTEEVGAAHAEAAGLRKYEDSVDEFKNGQLPENVLCRVEGYISHRLRCDAAAQFEHLNTAFRAQFGKDIAVTDTYRSLEDQIELKKVKPVLAGKPGTSNHGWGRAIDVASNIHWDYYTPEHQWMIENAPKFGWHNPTWAAEGGKKEEAWHWEFNGKYADMSDESSDAGAEDSKAIVAGEYAVETDRTAKPEGEDEA